MKASLAAAAALVAAASAGHAGNVGHRHVHDLFKVEKRGNDSSTCTPGCTTIYSTITGPAGLYTPPAAPTTSKPAPATTQLTTASPTGAPLPTGAVETCPTPGTYTFPATTVVVTETTTVCGASSTKVPSGTHTLGGVTTVVVEATTVVCPYATVKTEAGTVTSVIETTSYVCPSAGTYTVGAVTTVVATETVVVYPVVETFCPGTYTKDAAIVTVTETDYVYVCPFTTPAPAPAAPTAAAPPPPPPPAPTASAAAAKVAPAALGVSVSSSGGKGIGNLGQAIAYTPYTNEGGCMSASAVDSDIADMTAAGVTKVRCYSTDCDTLTSVGGACRSHGCKMYLGIFIDGSGCNPDTPAIAKQIADIKAWAQWDLVLTVMVGNEAMFNNYCSASQLAALITYTKSELASAGYTGSFTTTDVVSAWIGQDVSAVCDVIDFMTSNIHAYFNGGTTPDQAGDFVAGQIAIVEAVCNKPCYVGETGWPSNGKCLGAACAGPDEQQVALLSIKEKVGNVVTFFEFNNQGWKNPSDCGCEQFWGCKNLVGQLFS